LIKVGVVEVDIGGYYARASLLESLTTSKKTNNLLKLDSNTSLKETASRFAGSANDM